MRRVDEVGLQFLNKTVARIRGAKGALKSLLWHYTSGAGLRGILESQKVWSTHYSCLNDEAELKWGFKILLSAIDVHKDKYRNNEIAQIFFAQLRRLVFEEVLPELKQRPFGFTESYPNENYECFVSSFSEEGDDLAQWRAYGSGEGGYALGFEPEIFDDALEPSFSGCLALAPVVYNLEKQREITFEFLDAMVDALEQELSDASKAHRGGRDYQINSSARDALIVFSYIAPLLKSGAFRAEREWRILLRPVTLKMSEKLIEGMKFSVKPTVIARHIPINFRPTSLKEVEVGPSRFKEASSVSLRSMLRQKNIHRDLQISTSDAPFRPS